MVNYLVLSLPFLASSVDDDEEPRASPTTLQAISAFPLDRLGCVGVLIDPQKQRPVSVSVGTFLAYPAGVPFHL